MRAILVRPPIHITLETKDEQWQQGEVIRGVLKYKNESNESYELTGEVAAVYPTTIKEVREGTLPKVKSLFMVDLGASFSVGGGEEIEFPYEFTLPTDAPISDKNSGLFFYFGHPEFKVSSLALNITPHQRLSELLQNIELFLRFKTKSIKAKKDKIEIKMAPPPSKEYAGIEAVTMLSKFKDDDILIDYQIKVKKLDYSQASTQMTPALKKDVVKKSDKLAPSDYLIYGKAFNGEKVAARIDASFEDVKTKSII